MTLSHVKPLRPSFYDSPSYSTPLTLDFRTFTFQLILTHPTPLYFTSPMFTIDFASRLSQQGCMLWLFSRIFVLMRCYVFAITVNNVIVNCDRENKCMLCRERSELSTMYAMYAMAENIQTYRHSITDHDTLPNVCYVDTFSTLKTPSTLALQLALVRNPIDPRAMTMYAMYVDHANSPITTMYAMSTFDYANSQMRSYGCYS
jgi:hypothetical protein